MSQLEKKKKKSLHSTYSSSIISITKAKNKEISCDINFRKTMQFSTFLVCVRDR